MMATKYIVEIPDNNYWKKQIKCQDACPVHTDSRGYVKAIAEGDYEKAYLIARVPNPLASICGRICSAACEVSCRRGDIDESVSIRALKRFVTEKFGTESKIFPKNILESITRLKEFEGQCEDIEHIKFITDNFKLQTKLKDNSPSVGIIGCGPAGLAAAHDLCLMGIKPVIYEMESIPGGMLFLGIPEYRLPREVIKAEINLIQKLGTEIICNTKVGTDISFSEIRKKHNAVLIAVGAKKSRKISIPYIDASGVTGGIDFLRDISLKNKVNLGEKVIVIGGGNVAFDVARTLVRQTGYDVSRTALRQTGVKEVHLVCLESLEEMPADTLEIEEGREEGVVRHNSWGPKEILVDENGKACGVKFKRCLSVFDENKKFAPRFNEKEEFDLYADNIFLTVGQALDLSFIDTADVKINESGYLEVDNSKTITSADGVFCAGDVSLGPGLMIEAIANGKEAARQINSYIRKKPNQELKLSVQHSVLKNYQRKIGYEILKREGVPSLRPEERVLSVGNIVETGFTEEQSKCQGERCLDCAVNTIFDGEKCILCGGCADVCPEYCLRLVSTSNLKGDEKLDQLIDNYYLSFNPDNGGAIIKDETKCIRCGLCAERCPVDAITMEDFAFTNIIK